MFVYSIILVLNDKTILKEIAGNEEHEVHCYSSLYWRVLSFSLLVCVMVITICWTTSNSVMSMFLFQTSDCIGSFALLPLDFSLYRYLSQAETLWYAVFSCHIIKEIIIFLGGSGSVK